MKKAMFLVMGMLMAFVVFGQELTEKQRKLEFDKDKKEFLKRTKEGQIGVFPGESIEFTRNFMANAAGATAWGAVRIGGEKYRDYLKTNGAAEIYFGVFDTGLPNHPDVNKAIFRYRNFIDGEGVEDLHGHSTHVSGSLIGNPIGGMISPSAGLAEAGKGKLMIYKVLSNSGFGSMDGITRAVAVAIDDAREVMAKGGKVVWNFSLGGGTQSYPPLADLFNQAINMGVIICCANGNSYGRGVNFPANHPGNLAISAGKQSAGAMIIADFSTYGPETFGIAPGEEILSCLPGGAYGSWSGTSMATPNLASTIGAYWSVNSKLTAAQVIEAVRKAAIDLGPIGKDEKYGNGEFLFDKLFSGTPPPPPPAPDCIPPLPDKILVKSISSSGAILYCSQVAQNYNFRYRPLNTTEWKETNWQVNNVAIFGLKANTVYEVQVQIECSPGKRSNVSYSAAFKTLAESVDPIKNYFEWKAYATPPGDALYMYWKASGQSQMQSTKLTNIKLRVWTNGFEWMQDKVMKEVYDFFSPNRGFMLRPNDDNETAIRWGGHFLLMKLKEVFGASGTKFELVGICGETSGGYTGVRYNDVTNFAMPMGEAAGIQFFEIPDNTKPKNWWYE